MIKITAETLSVEKIVGEIKTSGSGCVATYVGLIRDNYKGKPVAMVEYRDSSGNAEAKLKEIEDEILKKWEVEGVAIYHRTDVLNVGDINLVVAIAAAHRGEGFAACAYAIDRFKEKLPTYKRETYTDGTTRIQEA